LRGAIWLRGTLRKHPAFWDTALSPPH
jgi:hypothetical protein